MPQNDDDFSLEDFDVDDDATKVNVPSDATEEDLAAFDAAADHESDLLGLTDEPASPPAKRAAAKSMASAKAAAAGKPTPSAPQAAAQSRVVNVAADIPVQLVAVLGKKNLVLNDLLHVQTGDVLEFATPLTTTVDLVANGKLFARGELVEIEGTMGVRIVQLLK